MPPIPDPKLRACLAVLSTACARARLIGYEGQRAGLTPHRAELLADLMDAVQSLPQFMARWPSCNETRLRGMLEAFDYKWPSSGVALLKTYDQELASSGSALE
jgi:hypothetical protein